MKTFKGLYETCVSPANLRLAVRNAKKSKRIKKTIKRRHLSDDFLMLSTADYIQDFHNAEHELKQICDGITQKIRTIIVPTIDELLVQHAVCQALQPMFQKGMYEHTYASLPGRGAHKGRKVVEKWIKRDPKNTKYCLKMDIRKFFDNIPHDILKAKLARKIKDQKMLDLLFEIISVTESGLPLGFYTSQWLSNWYLMELDHYIKEQLGAKYYIRYMDDMVIYGANKKKLHRMREAIEAFLNEFLGLTLKDNWQVFRFSHGPEEDPNSLGRDLDFMGFRFYRTKVTLRRTIMLKASRKAQRIRKKEKATISDIRQMMSYYGWLTWTNTYDFYRKWIKPGISFHEFRKRVGRHALFEPMNVYHQLLKAYS